MTRLRLAALAVLLSSACLEKVDGGDVRCSLDTECPDGIACGLDGFCVPGLVRDPAMTCVGVAGRGPDCSCGAGLVRVDDFRCRAKTRCEREPAPCPAHSTCRATGDDTFACDCDAGYEPGDGTCDDVDECAADPALCDALGALNACENTDGGYSCGCVPGATKDGGTCVDVDECTEGTHTCASPATCANTSPGFRCDCPDGYVPDGANGCEDVDECEAADACPRFERCTNNVGAPPTCVCDSPYTRDGDGTCVMAWESVRAGVDHTCAIRNDGRLFCWGDNRRAQVGFGSNSPPTVAHPEPVYETWTVREVSVGNGNTCAILADRSLWCWGNNTDGQLGLGRRGDLEPQATRVGSANDWLKVAMGPRTTCGIREVSGTNQLYCWGSDDSGQLGLGRPPGSGPLLVPTRIPELDGVREVVVAASHVVAMTEGRGLGCWGSNTSGQCGRDPATTTHLRSATTLPGITNVKGIGAGNAMTCFSTSLGGPSTLSCMGTGPLGNVSNGWRASSWTPVRVGLANEWSDSFSVSAYSFVLALRPEGALYGWGETLDAQLGSFVESQGRPVALAPGRDFFVVSAGSRHACAINGDGVLSCWGANGSGEAGDGRGGDASGPVRAEAEGPFGALWATDSAFSFCAKVGGKASCWGASEDGGIVASIGTGPRPVPTTRFDDTTFREVATGATAACGILPTGGVQCWGTGGTGLTWPRDAHVNGIPRLIDARTDWATVRVGFDHACGLRNDGTLWCWGEDTPDGQLATGRETSGATVSRLDPVQAAPSLRFDTSPGRLSVRAGGGCAIEASPTAGRLHCWGSNDYGQLGVGDTSDSASLRAVGSETDWTWVAAGTSHTCGVRGGNLFCWGFCDSGECGLQATSSVEPRPLLASNFVEQVTVGTGFTCAISTDGSASCFGDGDEGQLGAGRFIPGVAGAIGVSTEGVGGTRWVSLAAIDATVCGSRDDGHLYCWGDDSGGALGRGTAWVRTIGRVAAP